MNLYSVADRLLAGQIFEIREIILIVIAGGDGGESGFCKDVVNCRKDAVHDNINAAYLR